MKEAGIDFALVFPDRSLKAEWVGRCFLRGSGEQFCQLIADRWDEWMDQMDVECTLNNLDYYILDHGDYLSDAMEYFERKRD